MFDRQQFDATLERIADHYERIAPTVTQWANDLAGMSDMKVTLADVYMVWALSELPPGNLAANDVYHLQHRLGRSVVGQIGF